MTQTRRVAVVGAGITGLAAAWRLASQPDPLHVTVFEMQDRAGGVINTVHRNGFLMELGPDSFITNKPGAIELCREIGFADCLISTDESCRRSLVLRSGRPYPVPEGFMLMAPSRPAAILSTPVLSPLGKLRLLGEVLIPRRQSTEDESLASFVRRRFGSETLDRLVQPLVGGIYTSDPEKLSLQATLPRFSQMEREYGSVIRGTLASQQKNTPTANAQGSGARYGLFMTPREGLSTLVDAVIAACLKTGRVNFCFCQNVQSVASIGSATADAAGDLLPSAPAQSLSAPPRQWKVTVQDQPPETFDAVVLTLPTHVVSRMLSAPPQAELRSALNTIEYASSAVVVTGHRLSDFRHPLDAFGLVIPHQERRNVLAVSFTSRKYAGRAPAGHVLLRTFVGGAMQPELLQRDDHEIQELVRHELQDLLGLHANPLFEQVARYQQAMPQYHVGHLQRVQRIEQLQLQFPGLQLAGSAYHGVGIPDSISSGRNAADQILANFRQEADAG